MDLELLVINTRYFFSLWRRKAAENVVAVYVSLHNSSVWREVLAFQRSYEQLNKERRYEGISILSSNLRILGNNYFYKEEVESCYLKVNIVDIFVFYFPWPLDSTESFLTPGSLGKTKVLWKFRHTGSIYSTNVNESLFTLQNPWKVHIYWVSDCNILNV